MRPELRKFFVLAGIVAAIVVGTVAAAAGGVAWIAGNLPDKKHEIR